MVTLSPGSRTKTGDTEMLKPVDRYTHAYTHQTHNERNEELNKRDFAPTRRIFTKNDENHLYQKCSKINETYML